LKSIKSGGFKPNRITVHCSDTPNLQRLDISVIRGWHKARGFKDVGYHLVIQPNGEVQRGRPLNVEGAAVRGSNKNNTHICLIGKDKFTSGQFAALRYYLDSVRMVHSIEMQEIYCHYEFESALEQGKTCPNMRAADIMCWYVSELDDPIKKYIKNP